MGVDNAYREKARPKIHKNAPSYTQQILEATSLRTATVWPPTSYL